MLPAFDGYPYLVIRIGRTPMRHVTVLPDDWPREKQLDLARRQVLANQLEGCLCLGAARVVDISTDGSTSDGTLVPTGVPVVDRLAPPEPIPPSPELTTRHDRLVAFARELTPKSGYLVGDNLEGGRPATAADQRRLSGTDGSGIPAGLVRCPDCLGFRGEFLALQGEGNGDMRPRVIEVHCACQNHNRCAACGEPLAKSRLSAYRWDEENGRVSYLAAYSGLGHRCA